MRRRFRNDRVRALAPRQEMLFQFERACAPRQRPTMRALIRELWRNRPRITEKRLEAILAAWNRVAEGYAATRKRESAEIQPGRPLPAKALRRLRDRVRKPSAARARVGAVLARLAAAEQAARRHGIDTPRKPLRVPLLTKENERGREWELSFRPENDADAATAVLGRSRKQLRQDLTSLDVPAHLRARFDALLVLTADDVSEKFRAALEERLSMDENSGDTAGN